MQPDHLRDDNALFLDFDGTLVEIAEHPEKVHLPLRLPGLLQRVRSRLGGALGLISGRRLADLDGWFQPMVFAGSGLHGIELRRSPEAPVEELQTTDMRAAARLLKAGIAQLPGVWIEDKQRSLACHFRAAPDAAVFCIELAETVAAHFSLQVVRGKLVVELKAAGADKGTALSTLMQEPLFAGRRPVFIGDDVTDEDGFLAADSCGGFGIRIGPGETAARFRLPDVAAVVAYIGCILTKDPA